MPKQGQLFVLSGPSGVGKGTVLKQVLRRLPNLRVSVSATTRPPAKGEQHGKDYYFLTDEAFASLVKEDGFLEWAEVFGHRYGTPRAWVEEQLAAGTDVMLEIDVQGGMQVREKFPPAHLIFLLPPSPQELERRIRTRDRDSASERARRLAVAQTELKRAPEYDCQILNDNLDDAVEAVCRFIEAHNTPGTEAEGSP